MPAEPKAIVEPLSEMELALVTQVGHWRDENQKRLEVAFQKLLSEANARVAPVLRAHGVVPGDEWSIIKDEASATGWSLERKPGALAGAQQPGFDAVGKPVADPSIAPISRATKQRAKREIQKALKHRGGKR